MWEDCSSIHTNLFWSDCRIPLGNIVLSVSGKREREVWVEAESRSRDVSEIGYYDAVTNRYTRCCDTFVHLTDVCAIRPGLFLAYGNDGEGHGTLFFLHIDLSVLHESGGVLTGAHFGAE
ncbi:hypothetical protein KIPB_004413 [Kipferlia bialata]|uniref:Uncharacterized protein n=1 Tax=Kipferlia bialata TaxID=797122 RepID=A0A9K3GHS7_9EUKA|nr:hypothetical protein KIPB_004413 [Kipferlia bialata]|eukprot:g4413.t1